MKSIAVLTEPELLAPQPTLMQPSIPLSTPSPDERDPASSGFSFIVNGVDIRNWRNVLPRYGYTREIT
ncbi:MAG TPA: hypothetical protein VD998_01105 [Verrucomicrobiae bacterium]|nr:hypothetical protein [Verrucomicrobiae bacterium]